MLETVLQAPATIIAATLLRDLGFLIHAGGITTFALLATLTARFGGPPVATVLRVYRAFGPGLGISLGLTVLGAITSHYGVTGALSWSPSVMEGGWFGTLAWLSFFVAWVSNIQLEVWTLEPLRKLDPLGTGKAVDAALLDRSTNRVVRHLVFQAVLLGVVLVFARFATL